MSDPTPPLPDDQRSKLLQVATDLCYCSKRLELERKRDGKLPTKSPGEMHDNEQEIISPLLADGFDLVGTGAGRCVLQFPEDLPLSDHIVKLARFGDDPTNVGISQNLREVVLWTRHGGCGQWPLLPVTHHHERYRWLTMPYGEPLSDQGEEVRTRAVREIQHRLAKLPDLDLREVREDNIVIRDDEPLMADYGRPSGY